MFGTAIRFLKRENISNNNRESLFKQLQEYWLWTKKSSNRGGTMFADTQYLFSEKAMAPHSSTLAWKIPWMEEPGRLQSVGSLRVGQD